MIFDKLIYDVREALNEYSDDSNISNRYIEYLYQIKRAKYIRQDLDQFNRSVDNSIIQTYCSPLIEVSASGCGVDIGCETLLRTEKKVPTPIDLSTKPSIISIRPTTKIARPFNFVDKSRINNIDGSPFKNAIYTFLDEDGYIYVYSRGEDYKHLNCLKISGVFVDPLELANFKNCCDCDDTNVCFDRMKMNYPIQPRYIDLIRQEIVQELFQKKQIPEDKENDSSNIMSQQSQGSRERRRRDE